MVLAVVVPEWIGSWGFALLLMAVVVVALFRPGKVFVALAIVMCIATLAFREFSTIAVARSLIQERQVQHTWTREYSEGVIDVRRYAVATSPYVILAGLGLACLAARRYPRGTRSDR